LYVFLFLGGPSDNFIDFYPERLDIVFRVIASIIGSPEEIEETIEETIVRPLPQCKPPHVFPDLEPEVPLTPRERFYKTLARLTLRAILERLKFL
jgi:hypothetical protein